MSVSAEFMQAFERARQLHADGHLSDAEHAYRQLAMPGKPREAALRALVEIYMEGGRLQEAIATMIALTEEIPDRLYYYARLAALLEGCGQLDQAIGHYLRLLQRQPGNGEAHYNLALLYKKSRRLSEAMTSYQNAVKAGVRDVEEVFSNMGVLYSDLRQGDKAREMYERALAVKPAYVPALFNLAGLLEEAGDRSQAVRLYEQILSLNPRHWESLARLAYARRLTAVDQPLIDALRDAISETDAEPVANESLHFALGKALDDIGQYAEAFAAYRAGNDLGKLRNPAYDRATAERAFDQLKQFFSADWMRRAVGASDARPIFICGMFRSGSTLVEQVLASHPSVMPGGELDYLPWLVAQRLAPYPGRLNDISPGELRQIGEEYLSGLQSLFPDAQYITDKRPDNFLHLGLIKTLFPSARIVYTKRNPLDNCLSVYFQQLGGNLGYATDLEDIAHFYQQHVRLMAHWSACFAEDIFTVDYDALVHSPEPVLRHLLAFLGLEWDQACLNFQQTGNLVKTASVWQVREGLYTHSSERWRHYAPFLQGVQAILEKG